MLISLPALGFSYLANRKIIARRTWRRARGPAARHGPAGREASSRRVRGGSETGAGRALPYLLSLALIFSTSVEEVDRGRGAAVAEGMGGTIFESGAKRPSPRASQAGTGLPSASW